MKSPLFKDNIEDREIRFKAPEEIDVIHNKERSKGISQESFDKGVK
ncbi:MAG: hypothetical protein K2I46_01900 [Clostridia bacterium]|nr:hypothetical protein [Clostridia bacterium]MDE6471695.1 hypothetical protein [Clostridia bacterium]